MTDTAGRTNPASSSGQRGGGAEADAPYASRELPARPPLSNPNAAPVLVKATPPFSIRLTQLLWVLSFGVGAFSVVYLFVIRQELLPLLAERAETVTADRSQQAYESAAEIVFWVVFGVLVGVLLAQITLLVSFMSRRPQVRWWQLLTLALLSLVVVLSPEWVAQGPQGAPLQPLLAAQGALVLLALLVSILPPATGWSARRFDVRRGPQGPARADL
jgi:hypothetical protein